MNPHYRHPLFYSTNNSCIFELKLPWIASNLRNLLFFSRFINTILVLWFWMKNRVETDYLPFHGLLNPKNCTHALAKNSNRDLQTVQLGKSRSTWTTVSTSCLTQNHNEWSNLEVIFKEKNDIEVTSKQVRWKSQGKIGLAYHLHCSGLLELVALWFSTPRGNFWTRRAGAKIFAPLDSS